MGAYPSLDSDEAFTGADAPQTTNGSATVVSASHAFITGGSSVTLDHVGPVSGPYSWGTHVYYAAPIQAIDADDVDAFSQPWQIRVDNADAPNSQVALGESRSLNRDATPDLATDMRISGAGLNPTVTWINNGASDTVTITLFRVIDDESDLIRQVHSEQLTGSANSFVIPSEFSGTPTLEGVGADSSLTFGEQYVMLVTNQDRSADGDVEGVARSWFEFTAVEDNGQGDAAIYIPTVYNGSGDGGQAICLRHRGHCRGGDTDRSGGRRRVHLRDGRGRSQLRDRSPADASRGGRVLRPLPFRRER